MAMGLSASQVAAQRPLHKDKGQLIIDKTRLDGHVFTGNASGHALIHKPPNLFWMLKRSRRESHCPLRVYSNGPATRQGGL